MAVMLALAVQGVQMLLLLLLAPLLTGLTRKVRARILSRRGPPLLQPYRDLIRLMRKDAMLAENASWLFRVIPYIVFAATWVAAALVPTFATGLIFSWSADMIAIIAFLATARFFLALAGLDVGTSFGGIGSSREVMIASLAEPAMLMTVFTLALIAGVFLPWGLAPAGAGPAAYATGFGAYLVKLAAGGFLLAVFETSIAKMRVFRVPQFLGAALMLGLLAALLRFVSGGL